MPDLGSIPTILSGFTPGAAGIWTLVLMGAAYFAREWRESRKLSSEDKQARREGYAKQVENLQKENRLLRADLRQVERDHDEYRALCIEENSSLRRMLRSVEDHVVGLERQLLAAGIAVIRNFTPGEVSSEVAAATERAATHMRERHEDGRHDEPGS